MAWKDELPAPGLKPYHEQMRDAADAWESDADAKVAAKQDAATLDADVAANVANGSSATGAAVIDQIDALAQPLDSDLTAIAALSTTPFGRSLLELADAAAGRTALEVGRTITGSGVPEGVVAAPVGTKYIDTAATRGAREWMKATGTGSTGWIVTIGDTGWRDVRSLLTTGWSATRFLMRRTGSAIDMQVWDLSSATGFTGTVLTIPTEFRPAVALPGWLESIAEPPTRRRYSIAATMSIASVEGDPALRGILHWPTDQEWPTTLPGTPA